jgi:hypothetical protein
MTCCAADSVSVTCRKEGNKWYGKGLDDGLAPTLAKDRLLKAAAAYDKARITARGNLEELSSATKNLGLSYWRISQRLKNSQDKGNKEVYFYQSEALKFLSHAHETSKKTD